MTMLTVAVVVLWVVVAVLSVLVVLLYRQFGLLYLGSRNRIALTGLDVGSSAPSDIAVEVERRLVNWDWRAAGSGRATLTIFAVARCPLCDKLVPDLNSFADKWGELVDVLFIEKGPLPDGPTHDLATRTAWTYAVTPDGDLHDAFDVEATPFAFLISSSGTVLAKGLVNTTQHLEGVIGLALDERGRLIPDALAGTLPVEAGIESEMQANGSRTIREETHV